MGFSASIYAQMECFLSIFQSNHVIMIASQGLEGAQHDEVTCLSHAKRNFNKNHNLILIAGVVMEKFSQFRDRGKPVQLRGPSTPNI